MSEAREAQWGVIGLPARLFHRIPALGAVDPAMNVGYEVGVDPHEPLDRS